MIIGRDKEQRELHEAYESEYSEFAMVTVSGIAHAGYWSEIHNSITSEDLFKA